MSSAYHFFGEYRDGRSWHCLPELVRRYPGGTVAGPLFRIGSRSPLAALFFADASLLGLHQGLPPQPPCQDVLPRVADQSSWWTGFEELLVDHWGESSVLVSSAVEWRYAGCFGDGELPFPEEALVARGMDRCEAQVLRDSRFRVLLDGAAIDRRYEFRWASDHVEVEVTWTRSVAELLGPDRVAAVQAVRRRWRDEDLRFVVGWG